MDRFALLPLIVALTLMGCGTQPVAATADPVRLADESGPSPHTGLALEDEKSAQPEVKLPAIPLTDDLLYKFLVSEIAGQRGMISVAKEGYLDLARQTKDPRVVKRAAEIAVFSRDADAALESTRMWLELEPASPRALQTLVALLVAQGKLDEATPYLEKMLVSDGPANGFMHLTVLFSKTRDTKAAYQAIRKLAAGHPAVPEAQYALAQAAIQAGKTDDALDALKQADALRPGWETAATLRAQLLAKQSRSDALSFMKGFLQTHPQSREVRLAYARMLVNANQFDEAREQFALLTTEMPDNADVHVAAGLLSLQMADPDRAETYLTRALEQGYRDVEMVRYYLGQVSEERKQDAQAISRYESVAKGEHLVSARTRHAGILARQGKLADAIALLKSTEVANDGQRIQLIQAESNLLRDAKDYEGVYKLLDNALKQRPDHIDLLYDRAMAAEKINKLDVAEADLRKVIKLKPDYAHAYNALGYTLVEKTDRINEAAELLEKALSLAPDDAFILDSMGWLHYRKGNLDKAREYLERAWKLRQDPEIAAHLGEVLWMKGSRDEASKLWDTTLQSYPNNEALLETLKKFKR
jgi:tetratricopeptide (TPR) repeat protein